MGQIHRESTKAIHPVPMHIQQWKALSSVLSGSLAANIKTFAARCKPYSKVQIRTIAFNSSAVIFFAIFASTSLFAEERWTVQGNELMFKMHISHDDLPNSREIIAQDAAEFRLLIMEHPEVEVVAVSGKGGYGPASIEISNTIVQFGLDTRAFGECLSACARIFLAGARRVLSENAVLGFHRPYVIGNEERDFYLFHREDRGWVNEFDYVEFIYDVGLIDMLEEIQFMTSRGVSLEFIFQAYSFPSRQMWRPDRSTLIEAGVILR